eukprot:m.972422 g.972422  ORF g.972422 m.972422 type:complete len:177 (-) comp23929_c0_seq18:22-552(-)
MVVHRFNRTRKNSTMSTRKNFHEIADSEQLRDLKQHVGAVLKVGTVVADYIKKKAALQEKYAADMLTLTEQCEQRTNPLQLRGIEGHGDLSVLRLWSDMRACNINEAEAFNKLAEMHRASASDLSTRLSQKKNIIELVFSDCKEMETSVKRLEGKFGIYWRSIDRASIFCRWWSKH